MFIILPFSTPQCKKSLLLTRKETLSILSSRKDERVSIRIAISLLSLRYAKLRHRLLPIFSASSSEISISNSSSNSITSSTTSNESAPRSSRKDASILTSLSSTPRRSTITFVTRSTTVAKSVTSSQEKWKASFRCGRHKTDCLSGVLCRTGELAYARASDAWNWTTKKSECAWSRGDRHKTGWRSGVLCAAQPDRLMTRASRRWSLDNKANVEAPNTNERSLNAPLPVATRRGKVHSSLLYVQSASIT